LPPHFAWTALICRIGGGIASADGGEGSFDRHAMDAGA